jgi:hypothetical protein
MWLEAVMVYFELLPHLFPEGSEENEKKVLSQPG